jgi:Leucine-rich repeat (LRR) protein
LSQIRRTRVEARDYILSLSCSDALSFSNNVLASWSYLGPVIANYSSLLDWVP